MSKIFTHEKFGEIDVERIDNRCWFDAKALCKILGFPDSQYDDYMRLYLQKSDYQALKQRYYVNFAGFCALMSGGNQEFSFELKKFIVKILGEYNDPMDVIEEVEPKGIEIYKNPQFGNIRVIEKDGEPWFVGVDVASKLGYGNYRDALKRHVEAEDKGVVKTDTPGGKQELTIINESGLYSLILSSRLPSARVFKSWVTK